MKNNEVKKPGLYTAGLVLGIIAVCLFLNPFIAFLCGLLALIFGSVAYANGYKKKAPILLGSIAILLVVIEIALLIIFRNQIINSIERKGKRVVKSIESDIRENLEDNIKEGKDNLGEETKESLNEAFNEIEQSFKNALEES